MHTLSKLPSPWFLELSRVLAALRQIDNAIKRVVNLVALLKATKRYMVVTFLGRITGIQVVMKEFVWTKLALALSMMRVVVMELTSTPPE